MLSALGLYAIAPFARPSVSLSVTRRRVDQSKTVAVGITVCNFHHTV